MRTLQGQTDSSSIAKGRAVLHREHQIRFPRAGGVQNILGSLAAAGPHPETLADAARPAGPAAGASESSYPEAGPESAGPEAGPSGREAGPSGSAAGPSEPADSSEAGKNGPEAGPSGREAGPSGARGKDGGNQEVWMKTALRQSSK
ncbi:hypothetical protein T484DRAFT_1798519, partial [Baffinella frigidus]